MGPNKTSIGPNNIPSVVNNRDLSCIMQTNSKLSKRILKTDAKSLTENGNFS